jgi:hypothetical protein
MLLICLDVPGQPASSWDFPMVASRSAVAQRPEDLDQPRPADASAISSHAGSAAAPARKVRYGSASTAASPSRTSIGARCSRAPLATAMAIARTQITLNAADERVPAEMLDTISWHVSAAYADALAAPPSPAMAS